MADKDLNVNKDFVFSADTSYPKDDFDNPNFIDAKLIDNLVNSFEITYNLDISGIDKYIYGIDGNYLYSPGEITDDMVSFKPGINDKKMREEVLNVLNDLRIALLHPGEEW